MKFATIVGARPNFIKLAPISREIRKKSREIIIHTGQHYDYEMDKVFFDDLKIPEPNYHLGVGSGSHGSQTGEMLKRIESVLLSEKPEIVIVFGDTNTTLAGALAAVKLNIKTAHIEAGLRAYDKTMPEEVNRVLVDHCSDVLLCPTQNAVANLKKEGIERNVHFTGDVMLDVQMACVSIAERSSRILQELGLRSNEYYLATIHRAANTDNPERLENIVAALETLGEVVLPCHPRTEKLLREYGLWERLAKHVRIVKPMGYLDMLMLEKHARKILTDSGGVQKEAYFLGVPCITLREESEWIETVEDGWNILAGADRNRIVRLAKEFHPEKKRRTAYGKGDAAIKIVKILTAE
jgi:UDP-N-acetylglucosamine 2-epimerase (non-hydrolysing)